MVKFEPQRQRIKGKEGLWAGGKEAVEEKDGGQRGPTRRVGLNGAKILAPFSCYSHLVDEGAWG